MMIKSPILQRVIDGVFIGMDPRSGRNEGLDEEVTSFLEFRGYSSLEYPKHRNKNFYFCTHNPMYYIVVWDTETYWFEGKTHV